MPYNYVPIPKEDTYELIRRAQEGDEAAKTEIISNNTGLVKKIALKFVQTEYETEDLIQIGYIGLLKAVYKFRPGYNVMFSTYAVPMIMGEIKRFFRDNGKIKASRSLKSEFYTLRKAQEALIQKNGTAPRMSQLAESTGMTAEHVLEVMEAGSALSNIASLDNQPVEEEYESYYSEGSPENNLDSIVLKQEIAALEFKERQVVVLRFYRDMTQQEIADIMGISQVQVSRIEKKALKKIKIRIEECQSSTF